MGTEIQGDIYIDGSKYEGVTLFQGKPLPTDNELKKEEKMFNQFEETSTKVITVDKHTYELIAAHDLRAIHLNKSTATALSKLPSFLIFCEDAAIEVNFTNIYESQVGGALSSLSVVEFELADDAKSD